MIKGFITSNFIKLFEFKTILEFFYNYFYTQYEVEKWNLNKILIIKNYFNLDHT